MEEREGGREGREGGREGGRVSGTFVAERHGVLEHGPLAFAILTAERGVEAGAWGKGQVRGGETQARGKEGGREGGRGGRGTGHPPKRN